MPFQQAIECCIGAEILNDFTLLFLNCCQGLHFGAPSSYNGAITLKET